MAKDFWNSFIRDKSGQSLMEIIVGLSIGAILIGTASLGLAFMLRSSTTNQNLSTASQVTQGALSNIQSFSNSSWQNIYGLSKGSGNQYFLNASGTLYLAVQGQEGLVSNDITSGLVGEWKFDETTGTVAYDATGGNSNGTLTNGPTRATSTCKIANCLSFNGASDYVNIPYRPTFRNALTSSIWIKRTTDFNQLADVMFLSPPNAWYFYDSYNSGNIHGDVFIDSVRRGATNVSVPYDGNWYHMVYTYDSATHFSKMYKNGVLAASVEITGLSNYLIDSATGNLARLGSQALGRGMILDDARIYNRALSATEVAQLYNSQVFSRYFYVENVCRISDSSGNIASSTTPCPNGTADDPLTQKVTAITQWTFGAGADQVSLSRYLSRWGNFSIRQSDWSGGSGQNGVITSPNSLYSTSTNITATDTLGSFEILNLSQ